MSFLVLIMAGVNTKSGALLAMTLADRRMGPVSGELNRWQVFQRHVKLSILIV